MIRFIDGPAAGVELRLMRTPVMLRVVRSAGGNWDALDQPDDTPAPREQLFVYRIASKPTHMFIRCQPRSASGLYIRADYRLFPNQPTDEQMRQNFAWAAWCDSIQTQVLTEIRAEGIA
jgi:hypothetical protein